MSEYDEFVERLTKTPPTCLRACLVEPAELPKYWDDNPKSVWKIQCRCGGDKGRLLGHSLQDFKPQYAGPLSFISPLAVECGDCGETTDFFDTDIHGYHADLDARDSLREGACKIRGSGQRMAYRCPACSSDIFTLVTAFVFWNADELAEEFEDRWEDLFNVFLCYACCCSCGNVSEPTEFGKL